MKVLLFIFVFALNAYCLPIVTVSIPPQKYIVEKIAGDSLKVNVIVPTGSDPHSFAPKSAQIQAIADSKLYLAIGFPFEQSLIPQISKSMKGLKTVETQQRIAMIKDEHEHEDEDEDGHEAELDPHVWTSPKSMLIVAENTYTALVEAFPQLKSQFDVGYANLKAEITKYDTEFTAAIAKSTKIFLVYHPAYGYLARDYGLTQLAVERDGKEPKAMELREIINTAKSAKVQLFIVSPQQSATAAKVIAGELGIGLTVVDNLNEDWGATMLILKQAF